LYIHSIKKQLVKTWKEHSGNIKYREKQYSQNKAAIPDKQY